MFRNFANKCADNMLTKITQCINDKIKTTPSYQGAIVSSVNENGSVNVYLPPNDTKIFTNISNQTPFELQPGDSVELVLKDGTYNNCWVCAKHGISFKKSE